jgi:hypothetical protein
VAEIKIFDNLFSEFAKSCTLRDENADVYPKHFTWRKDGPITSPVFFTDSNIADIVKFGPHLNAVALLLEPFCLHEGPYQAAEEYKDFYRAVLTFDERFVDGKKWLPYIKGGSGIAFDKWGLQEKEFDLSIIVSHKRGLEGHRLRHEVVERHRENINGIFGSGYQKIESKLTGLAPYRYSIVIENCLISGYFADQAIDAMCVGTVPIYRGNPKMGELFNPKGIIPFDTIEDLDVILLQISEEDYESRLPAIKENIEICSKYAIAENWIWENQPQIFEDIR